MGGGGRGVHGLQVLSEAVLRLSEMVLRLLEAVMRMSEVMGRRGIARDRPSRIDILNHGLELGLHELQLLEDLCLGALNVGSRRHLLELGVELQLRGQPRTEVLDRSLAGLLFRRYGARWRGLRRHRWLLIRLKYIDLNYYCSLSIYLSLKESLISRKQL